MTRGDQSLVHTGRLYSRRNRRL